MRELKTGHYELRPLHEFKVTYKESKKELTADALLDLMIALYKAQSSQLPAYIPNNRPHHYAVESTVDDVYNLREDFL